jgi:hypothetical protein
MTIAAAERKVARCKEALRQAYVELRAARHASLHREDGALEDANGKLEAFCASHLERHPNDKLGCLPLRLRFVVCSLAAGKTRRWIAAALPKVNGRGQYVRMGITLGGLSHLTFQARRAL